MGLKIDSSFLKFVTMGALGTRRVHELMTRAGLQPIELERYSRSNKIWSTKVKRLRLPDLLCVKTGLRVEVRAKSKFAIKMSDAENNPDRRWNTGLADRDMIAFIQIRELALGQMIAADHAELFWVEDLRTTETRSRLGPPKSASEGAEKDREWPSIVAKQNGVVEAVSQDRFVAILENGRRQTYQLRGRSLYVAVGNAFAADSQFLAGVPPAKAAFPNVRQSRWNPRALLRSDSAVDRYVAVKALGIVGKSTDVRAVRRIAEGDAEGRVALEAAATLVRLGENRGIEMLRGAIQNPTIDFLRMEALLALAEFRGAALGAQCAQLLLDTARNDALRGDEARQAAIWGLGKDGLGAYRELTHFLDAESDEELVHAICAFGSDAGVKLADELIAVIVDANSSPRRRASASFILAQTIPTEIAAPRLVAQSNVARIDAKNWVLATLGQMNPTLVGPYVKDAKLAAQLEPLHLTAPQTNWTRSERLVDLLSFVRKQTML